MEHLRDTLIFMAGTFVSFRHIYFPSISTWETNFKYAVIASLNTPAQDLSLTTPHVYLSFPPHLWRTRNRWHVCILRSHTKKSYGAVKRYTPTKEIYDLTMLILYYGKQDSSAPRKFGIRTNRHRIFFQTNVITFYKIKSTKVKKNPFMIV